MMRLLALTAALLGATPLAAQVAPASNGGAELVDRVVAVVGDTVLLLSDVQDELNQAAAGGQLPEDPAGREQFAREVFEQKVNDLILVSAAREAGVMVDEEQVQEQVAQQMRQVEQRFGSASALDAALAESGMTRDQYRAGLADVMRDEFLRQDFLRGRLANRAPPVIDERDIRQFFDTQRGSLGQRPATISFRQVVIAPEPTPEERQRAREEAQQVLDELNAGADFEVLARRFSDDPGSAEHGGDLGWFGPGRMTPPFEQAAFALRPGQTSGIVESDFGYHIIRVDRTRGPERQARHILISPEVTEADIERARERADSVYQAIEGGASVTSLASRYNSDEFPATLTRVVTDRLPPAYVQPLQAAEANELVGPVAIEDPRGTRWLVARVTEKLPAGEYTLDDVRDQIRQRLEQQAMVEGLLEELRQQVYVESLM